MNDDDPIYRQLRRERDGPRHSLNPDHPDYREHPPLREEPATVTSTDVTVYEPTDPRLGRHIVHDPRSRAYALPDLAAPTQAIAWPRVGPILDQGQVGSCTANAALGLLMTQPFSTGATYTEQDALSLYHDETVLDDSEIPGQYPPNDTGSAGIYAMKALQNRKLITSYSHAFTLNAALAALATGPIAVGTVWMDSMMDPDKNGILKVDRKAKPAGGHEYVIDGYDPKGYVRMTNSWSASWGKGGQAWIALADFSWLLSQQGDVVQPVVVTQPAPGPVNPQPSPTPTPQPSNDDAFLRWLRQTIQTIDAWLKSHGF